MARHGPGHSGPAVRPDQVIARMIRAVNLAARPFTRELGARYGISLNEWRCIRIIAVEGGVGSASALAERTGLDKMSTSRAVNGLERKGLVVRERDAADRRRYRIALSEPGRTLTEALVPASTARADLMLGSLSVRERTQLMDMLDRIIERVRAEPD